ncbi:dihydropteroate synthase [uncultured Duncaniella sp.]|uniref:dihydropteroate synthase n=15 Tax=Duncaniella TaxID=2518495 RepID=A0A4Z0V435_9BACT|nr:dihydropteroate synthase [uncultured Duncaniella sp.]TGG36678.1 dihydropteroate synthase [Duncaniella freteri]
MFTPFSLNIRGRLFEYDKPAVMGIVNVTPDSFFAGSRSSTIPEIAKRVEEMITAGADMLDLGAYSSRPGASDVSEEEECRRIALGMKVIRDISQDIPVSVDTFRAGVAREAVVNLGADIVNDISGGDLDQEMWATVADLNAPYILMHMRGNPSTMQALTEYHDVTADVISDLSEKLRRLRLMGVSDIIIDPGFGFSKTTEQNFEMMRNLQLFKSSLGAPVLVGVSRKSMITKSLGITPMEALPGTIALDTIALTRGASILRVHDVSEAVAAVRMYELSTL